MVQVAAGQQFCDEIGHSFMLPIVEQLEDVRVAQSANRLGFSLEARQETVVLDKVCPDHLDGDVAGNIKLARPVNGRHATLTEYPGNFVLSQALPDQRGHM